ncbi:MAG: PrpF domain-containing protein [Pseudomonadota bacterium]|nr:PrpF domain-containing protein [Pseudomonadota bacterium]
MQQRKIPAVFMRGGTSKALMFHRRDLPSDTSLWPELFVAALGANDPYGRQLDGMGGGISSLSKVCVVSPSEKPGADIDYSFFQLNPTTDLVDLSASCGNMSAAVGPFAVDEGLVSSVGTEARVRIFSTNTTRMIHSSFSVDQGEAVVDGKMSLPGVAGLGSPVRLEFKNPGGGATGHLLPTGKPVDEIRLPGGTSIKASMADAGNPCVFVQARDLGLTGTEMPDEIQRNPQILESLEAVRCQASVLMGIARDIGEASRIPGIPKIAFLSPAQDMTTLAGETVSAAECDILVRMISLGQPHRAIPVTGALCVAVAARVDGSLVSRMFDTTRCGSELRLAHPSGVTNVDARLEQREGNWYAASVTIYRTARRLMDGYVYVPAARTPGLGERS